MKRLRLIALLLLVFSTSICYAQRKTVSINHTWRFALTEANGPAGETFDDSSWAPVSTGEREALAYNLGNDAIAEKSGDRVFDISINGQKVMENLDMAQCFGAGTAVIQKFIVNVSDEHGLRVDFNKVKESPCSTLSEYTGITKP